MKKRHAGRISRSVPLSVDETIDVATRMIDRDGPASFSMRRLASELDVNPMTIYLRFDNKEALLRAVSARRLSGLSFRTEHTSWEDRVLALAVTIRETVLASGSASALIADDNDVSLAVVQLTDHGLDLMEQAGFHDEDAVRAYRAVFWHAVGSALVTTSMLAVGPASTDRAIDELPDDDVPTYRRLRDRFGAIDPALHFEESTRTLLRGLVASGHDLDRLPELRLGE